MLGLQKRPVKSLHGTSCSFHGIMCRGKNVQDTLVSNSITLCAVENFTRNIIIIILNLFSVCVENSFKLSCRNPKEISS